MNTIVLAALIALLVGAGGTGGGALLARFIKTTGRKLCAALIGISGGIIVAMVFFDMVPEALEIAGIFPAVLGMGLGALLLFLITHFIPHKDVAEFDPSIVQEIKTNHFARVGMLIAVGIAIHNLPQGIAIGSGIASGQSYGLGLALLLLAHNIPEGMSMAIPLKIGKVPYKKIMTLAMIAALPTVVGAVIGALVANISPVFIGGSIGFAAGAMGFLALREMIPEALCMSRCKTTVWWILLGIAGGGLLVWLVR